MKLGQQDRLLLGAVALSTGVLIILGGLQVRWSRRGSLRMSEHREGARRGVEQKTCRYRNTC